MITTTASELNGNTLTIHVPMRFRRRGGQKRVVVPRDTPQRPMRSRDESPLVRILARAFYWKRLIETGEHVTLADLAAAENVDKSNLGKILSLTLLAPDIVESILDGTEPGDLQIEMLLKPFPAKWDEQRRFLATEAFDA